MTSAVLWPVLAASLLGSVHCAAMCGSFVGVYAGAESLARRRALAHLAYSGGRALTYVTLGALSGALGHALDLSGRAAGLAHLGAIVSGAIMIGWGLSSMLEAQGVRLLRLRMPGALQARITRLIAGFQRQPLLARAALFGLTSTLLPCGFLYAFAVAAAGTGSALSGVLVMAAFWAGTLPMMLGLGAALSGALLPLRRHAPFVSASVLLALGLFTVAHRVGLPAFADLAHATPTRSLAVHTGLLLPSEPPCHANR